MADRKSGPHHPGKTGLSFPRKPVLQKMKMVEFRLKYRLYPKEK
jgi:hypothetical protein